MYDYLEVFHNIMIVLSVIRAVLTLLIIFVVWPLLLGTGLGLKRNLDRFIIGFCAEQALFFLVYIPAILMSWTSMALTIIGAVVISLAGAIGTWLRMKRSSDKKEFAALTKPDFSYFKNPYFDIALIIVIYQLVRYVVKQPYIYGDDVTYITMITDYVDTNAIYTKTWAGQLTPTPLSEISFKYVFTSYYPFMGMISMITGLHPLILCKTVIPVFYVPIHYLIIWRIGKYLFSDTEEEKKHRDKLSVFMFFYVLLIEFGQISYYTLSRRLMIWVWNSKSDCFCLLLIPLFFYTYLFLTEQDESERLLGKTKLFYRQLLVAIIALACNSSTLMGLILSAIVMGIWFIIAAFRCKKPSLFFASLWTLIPHLITTTLILLFTGWTF